MRGRIRGRGGRIRGQGGRIRGRGGRIRGQGGRIRGRGGRTRRNRMCVAKEIFHPENHIPRRMRSSAGPKLPSREYDLSKNVYL